MGKNCRSFEMHDFYCINCGEKSIPLMRGTNKKAAKNHRKNMYCYHCKHTVNHIECCTREEAEQFKQDFEKGLFKDEAAQELIYEKTAPRLSTLLA